MTIGMLGTRGSRGQWSAMIEAAYAAKINQAPRKSSESAKASTSVKKAEPTSQSAKNRATLNAIRKDIVADMLKK
jgi:hypothetical protein